MNMRPFPYGPGIDIVGRVTPEYAEILTPEAMALAAKLQRAFGGRRTDLLARRAQRQAEFDAGALPEFLPGTRAIRDGDWTCAPIPSDIVDRRVEITGPVDRKMVINALNSGANVFMADFEDANTPKWDNNVKGTSTCAMRFAAGSTTRPPKAKAYKLNREDRGAVRATARLAPAGEARADRREADLGGLFDFALYFFPQREGAASRGQRPVFLSAEAREPSRGADCGTDIFVMAQDELGVPARIVRATVPHRDAARRVRDGRDPLRAARPLGGSQLRALGLTSFSCIKKLRLNADFCLADRAQVTMTTHFMKSYALLLVKTCHRRNAHAMGGMAAQIPVKNDEAANAEAFAKVRADKEREATQGHDWHLGRAPGLVGVAKEAFDRLMPAPNQIATRKREDVRVTAADLLKFEPEAPITEKGLRLNINVAIQYVGAWLVGQGAVPIYNLMEDAATPRSRARRCGTGSGPPRASSMTAAKSRKRWSRR
jgi:malate synthase